MATKLPRNDELAVQFDLLADLMELEGADAFRIGAYRKAAARIRDTPSSVVTAAMGSHWQPIEIGMAATERANAAIEDHGVAELLRARLSEG